MPPSPPHKKGGGKKGKLNKIYTIKHEITLKRYILFIKYKVDNNTTYIRDSIF